MDGWIERGRKPRKRGKRRGESERGLTILRVSILTYGAGVFIDFSRGALEVDADGSMLKKGAKRRSRSGWEGG